VLYVEVLVPPLTLVLAADTVILMAVAVATFQGQIKSYAGAK